jgi:hypothetical protein
VDLTQLRSHLLRLFLPASSFQSYFWSLPPRHPSGTAAPSHGSPNDPETGLGLGVSQCPERTATAVIIQITPEQELSVSVQDPMRLNA